MELIGANLGFAAALFQTSRGYNRRRASEQRGALAKTWSHANRRGGHCCDRSQAKEFGLEPAVSPSASALSQRLWVLAALGALETSTMRLIPDESRLCCAGAVPDLGQAPGGHCGDRSQAKEFGLEPAVSPSALGLLSSGS